MIREKCITQERNHLFLQEPYFKVITSNYPSSFTQTDVDIVGLDKYPDAGKKIKKSKSFDNFFGQKMTKSQSGTSASSVVMALIKFYEKSKGKSEKDTNDEDTVSKLDHTPHTRTQELKLNFGTIVSEKAATHAIKIDAATGKRVVNACVRKLETPPQTDQTGNMLSTGQKGSKLRNKVSLKNNSMDEFLILVKKTKKKYKDLLEKDLEKPLENPTIEEVKPNNSETSGSAQFLKQENKMMKKLNNEEVNIAEIL